MARDPVIQREWQRLFDRFATRLCELEPASVLDVGCGQGLLLAQLTEAGIPATGIEPTATGQDPQIRQGDATKLPFADNTFDWATLRHVPHHLADYPAALRECLRVARTGLLIAEPWFDLSDPLQQISERWDLWWKRQHERAGDIHRPCLGVTELTPAFPGNYSIEAEHYRNVAHVSLQAIEDLSLPLLEALPQDDPDHAEYAEIAGLIRERGFTYNGTLIVTIRQEQQ